MIVNAKECRYLRSCVGWPEMDVYAEGGLVDMIQDSIEVTRRTFQSHVNAEELGNIEEALGYEKRTDRGLTMAEDYEVSYHRSKLHGKRAYYFKQSAIEHVFVKPGD